MIILKTLKWSNIFSYGKDNVINFDDNQITQILGVNGAGKSSIPLILQEVLFNKNSKGIKRGEIINRYISDKKYFISLEFSKDSENYLIETSRGTTQSVKLFKIVGDELEDLSSHTATSTYKQIENILGISWDIFISLIYQSSAQSMQFLVATDTVRKKFLIELLGLTRYTEAFEVFKEVSKEVASSVLETETKVNTIQKWLDKNSQVDLTVLNPLAEIDEPRELSEELGVLNLDIKNIEATNKAIIKNNQYKTILDSIVLDPTVNEPESNDALIRERANLEASKRNAASEISVAKSLKDTCPTCKQPVDISFVPSLIAEKENIVTLASDKLAQIQKALDSIAAETTRFRSAEKKKQEFESYSNLYNPNHPTELKDKDVLESRLAIIKSSILSIQGRIKEVNEHNHKVAAKNAEIKVITEQSAGMKADLDILSYDLEKISARLAILEILKKAFSTNGLLAYKIECLVKDLEDITNEYLSIISDGRFQLSFKVVSDKLNIIVTDNGIDIDILALSSGERARVNTATLLAIRKLMQALSATKVNLLILDETIDSLDGDGKEQLIEILLNEQGLNTFLVSHGYTHPLLEKITVIKENNISRLE